MICSLIKNKSRISFMLFFTGILISCGSDDAMMDSEARTGGYEDVGYTQDASYEPSPSDESDASSGVDVGTVEDVFVPENEEIIRLNLPVSSEQYVFVANSEFNSVAKINSITLSVTPIAVERYPTIIRTVPSADTAIVLNAGSDSVSIIDANDNDRVDSIEILPASNAMVLSPDGKYAVVYYDNNATSYLGRIGMLQEVELIDVENRRSFELSVGFHIREVVFSEDGLFAFVISDDGVTRIDMTTIEADSALRTIEVTDERLTNYLDFEVLISSSDNQAIVRTSELEGVILVDLLNGDRTIVELPGIPTDLDLTSSGRVVAAMRDVNMVAFFDVTNSEEPELIQVDDSIPAGIIRISGDEEEALIYTTLNYNFGLGILDLEGDDAGTITPWHLRKGIRAVAAGSDGASFLVVHNSSNMPIQPNDSLEERLEKSEAITVLNVDNYGSKFVMLDTEPDAFVFSEDGEHLFVMLSDENQNVKRVEWINLTTFRRITVELAGLPESIGTVPGTGRIFVSQESESGRLSFIDPEDGAVYNITAYQLNTYIE